MASSKLNVPDLLIGIGLFVLLPLLTWAIVGASSDSGPAPGPSGKKEPPLTLEEFKDVKENYQQMYSNAKLFMDRAAVIPAYASQEYGWAKTTLEHCKKVYADVKDKITAKMVTEEVEQVLPEINQALARLDQDLKMVAAGLATAPPIPAPGEARPQVGSGSISAPRAEAADMEPAGAKAGE